MKPVARIIDITNNKIIGKLYKEGNSLIAKPEVDDNNLPLVYYYKKKLYDRIEIAMELGVIDDLEINQNLLDDIENIFNTRYEIITMK